MELLSVNFREKVDHWLRKTVMTPVTLLSPMLLMKNSPNEPRMDGSVSLYVSLINLT